VSKSWEERKAIGDIPALHYKDLQAYLTEISGYTKPAGPKGSQMNMPGINLILKCYTFLLFFKQTVQTLQTLL